MNKLLTCRNVKNTYLTKSNLLTNEVNVDLYMLYALVLYRIHRHVNDKNIVKKKTTTAVEMGR